MGPLPSESYSDWAWLFAHVLYQHAHVHSRATELSTVSVLVSKHTAGVHLYLKSPTNTEQCSDIVQWFNVAVMDVADCTDATKK